MSTPGDDAQRDLEQRALRNVRALVDKIEATDASQSKSVRWQAAVIFAVVLALLALAYFATRSFTREPDRTLVLPPPASAPK